MIRPLHAPPAPIETQLRTGHTVVVTEDAIAVHAPDGTLQVEVHLTESGPVLRLSGARLELSSPGEVSVECRRFAVRASEEATIASEGTAEVTSAGELRLESGADLRATAEMIWLN